MLSRLSAPVQIAAVRRHRPCTAGCHQTASVIRETGFFMINRQCLTWSFLAFAALTGCADNLVSHTAPETPTVGSDRASVTGQVLHAQGGPPGGAPGGRTSGEHATADSTGAFPLDVPANTTLTLSATAPNMAPTLLQQFLVSPGASAVVELPMLTGDHFKSLVGMGANTMGGVVAVALRSMSGNGSLAGASGELTPSLGP